jgi:hypothetical protein
MAFLIFGAGMVTGAVVLIAITWLYVWLSGAAK